MAPTFGTEFKLNLAVYLALMLPYLLLIRFNSVHGWLDDNTDVAIAYIYSAVTTFTFLWNLHFENVEFFVFKITKNNVRLYGTFRVVLYIVSLLCLGVLVVVIADKVTTSFWGRARNEVLGRVKDNIVRIAEDRVRYDHAMLHPVTLGKEEPLIFHQLFRYPMEDVRMKCSTKIPWISGGSVFKDQIIWHLNGVPLKYSNRHLLEVQFQEIPENNSLLDKLLRDHGISVYEINATLSIDLLKESEFGSYTCHIAKSVKSSVVDYVNKHWHTGNSTSQHGSGKNAEDEPQTEEAGKEYAHCSFAPELKYMFKDLYTWKDEFRLIPLPKRQEILKLPPGSILSFTTSYWHLSRKDEVSMEYSVNENSFQQLCPGLFGGCSKVLLFYWLAGYEIEGRFGIPPLQLLTLWELPARRTAQVHCLCENSYGYHTVHYTRKYFSRTTERYELIEIPHPHQLVILPRAQDMLNVFVNRSAGPHRTDKPPKVKSAGTPCPCKCAGSVLHDMELVKDFAVTASSSFNWTELFLLATILLILLFGLWNIRHCLGSIGRLLRRLVLHGSFAFLTTAVLTTRSMQRDASGQREAFPFDMFLSHSDADDDMRIAREEVEPFLKQQGFRVCMRDRDLAANLQELPGLSDAIDKSKRVIFFLSRHYFDDHFRSKFEAAVVLETLCDRPAESYNVLLVKLDSCDIPTWLSHFPVLDWSGNLAAHENCRKLLSWLVPRDRKGALLSVLDGFMTCLPLLVTCVLLLLCSYTT